MSARTKYMDIGVFKIREWILDRHIKLRYCKTLSMIADLVGYEELEYQAVHLPAGRGEWLRTGESITCGEAPARGGDELHGHQH
jgi:hypothetical protein